MTPVHCLLPPEPANEEASALRTLLHSTQDALFASMSEAAAQAELVAALQAQLAAMAEGAEVLRRERDMLSEEAVGLRALTQDSVSADVLRTQLTQCQELRDSALVEVRRLQMERDAARSARTELCWQLAYCQQARRSLQESATLQAEGLRQEVDTLKGRLDEVGAQLLCTVRECAALLRRLRGAA